MTLQTHDVKKNGTNKEHICLDDAPIRHGSEDWYSPTKLLHMENNMKTTSENTIEISPTLLVLNI